VSFGLFILACTSFLGAAGYGTIFYKFQDSLPGDPTVFMLLSQLHWLSICKLFLEHATEYAGGAAAITLVIFGLHDLVKSRLSPKAS
jgi:hypothetical protein